MKTDQQFDAELDQQLAAQDEALRLDNELEQQEIAWSLRYMEEQQNA